MPPARRFPSRLIVAGALALAACGDQRATTAPLSPSDGPSAAMGNTRVKLKTLQLSANTLRIDGPGETASISIANSGVAIQSGVSIRGDVVQGAATRRAVNVPTQCLPGDAAGFLSTGQCNMTVPIIASHTEAGTGTLVPGPAELVMRVVQTTAEGEIELAMKSVSVNLVSSPVIATLALTSTTLAIDGPSTTWTATLQNPAKSLQGVLLQGEIVQGSAQFGAGGVVVSCGSALGVLPPGTCTVSFSASASTSAAGTGTLVPGPATFRLSMIQSANGTTTTLDVKTVAITLVSSSPVISSLALDATSIPIGGGVDYTVQLQNPGFPQTDIILQGEITQTTAAGTVVRGAGGTYIDCGAGLGNLPTIATGSCSIRFSVNASADPQGGQLVPGAATFILHLYKAPANVEPTEFDTETVAVTLVGPTISSLVPASSYVVLDQGFSTYKAVIDNAGPMRTGVVLQGWIRQGAARRAAGGSQIRCNGGPGSVLPTGQCIFLGDIVASSTASGTGTLTTGPATFELELIQVDGTSSRILDTRTAPITLVPTTPSIVDLDLASTIIPIEGGVRYQATLYNPTGTALSAATLQGYMIQGSTSRAAGGIVVSCGTSGGFPPGSCVVSFGVTASNEGSGTGTLVPGAAQFHLQLSNGSTLVDTEVVSVTLTSP